jgi:isoaspartyl peptidase/L-asparaginase-like protein (Ntn-hydrolase superfamily)
VLLAKTTCDLAASVHSAQGGAEAAIRLLAERVDGLGGVICLTARGEHGYAYNTPYMARGIGDQDGIKHIGI